MATRARLAIHHPPTPVRLPHSGILTHPEVHHLSAVRRVPPAVRTEVLPAVRRTGVLPAVRHLAEAAGAAADHTEEAPAGAAEAVHRPDDNLTIFSNRLA